MSDFYLYYKKNVSWPHHNIIMILRLLGLVIQMLETFSIKFFMGNRELQFAVTRLQLHAAGISGFEQGVHCFVPPRFL